MSRRGLQVRACFCGFGLDACQIRAKPVGSSGIAIATRKAPTMTTTPDGLTFDDRDCRIWQIQDILSRVRPDDMTDAELEAALAVFRLAEARLPGNRPMLRVELREDSPHES